MRGVPSWRLTRTRHRFSESLGLWLGGLGQKALQAMNECTLFVDFCLIPLSKTHYAKPQITSPIGRNDHNSVLWLPARQTPEPNNLVKRVVRPLRDSNIRDFGQGITNHNWEEVLHTDTADQKSTAFYSTLHGDIEQFIPNRTIKLHNKDQPWMTTKVKELIQKRQRAFHQGKTIMENAQKQGEKIHNTS